jgi:hypothetical protein
MSTDRRHVSSRSRSTAHSSGTISYRQIHIHASASASPAQYNLDQCIGELTRSADDPVPPIVTQDSTERYSNRHGRCPTSGSRKKKKGNSNGHTCMHIHNGFKMIPKADIHPASCFQSRKKKTPSPPPFITDYKLSYKNCDFCNFSSAHRLEWTCSLTLDQQGLRGAYLAKCRS